MLVIALVLIYIYIHGVYTFEENRKSKSNENRTKTRVFHFRFPWMTLRMFNLHERNKTHAQTHLPVVPPIVSRENVLVRKRGNPCFIVVVCFSPFLDPELSPEWTVVAFPGAMSATPQFIYHFQTLPYCMTSYECIILVWFYACLLLWHHRETACPLTMSHLQKERILSSPLCTPLSE